MTTRTKKTAATAPAEFTRTRDEKTLAAALAAVGWKVAGSTKKLTYVIPDGGTAADLYPLLCTQNGGIIGKPKQQPLINGLGYAIGMLTAIANGDDSKAAHMRLSGYHGPTDKCYTSDHNARWSAIRNHNRDGFPFIIPFDGPGNTPKSRTAVVSPEVNAALDDADELFG